MLVPGTNAAKKQREEEVKRAEEKSIGKKFEFRNGRDPENFPGVKFEVNDYEFTELLSELDLLYIAVHKINVTFVKYS
jgi:hypothetical protein